MLRFFGKKAFGGCKSQKFVIGYRIARRGDRVGEPNRRNMTMRLEGHSLNHEAPEVKLRGSWMLSTPSLGLLNSQRYALKV